MTSDHLIGPSGILSPRTTTWLRKHVTRLCAIGDMATDPDRAVPQIRSGYKLWGFW